jgi:hypothetical protein
MARRSVSISFGEFVRESRVVFAIFVVLLMFISLATDIRVRGQITRSREEERPQPVLKDLKVYACCGFVGSKIEVANYGNDDNHITSKLFRCVNNSVPSPGMHSASSRIALVTYITSNIVEYAAYELLLMAAYAEHHGYMLQVYGQDFHEVELEMGDQRWNKVIILHHALTTWAKEVDHIVWFDADLIFLDFGMKIELIVGTPEHAEADMLFSRDPKIDNGIMNSGCIMVKNTVWSKQFLMDWWVAFDRNDVMDQLVFDYMWYTRHDELSQHIILLAADAINTNFPAWVNQQTWNQVLHLAGGSTALRATVFRAGASELCRVAELSEDQQRLLPIHRLQPQLGITREYLVQIQQGRTLHFAMNHILQSINEINHDHRLSSSLNFNASMLASLSTDSTSSKGSTILHAKRTALKKIYGLINDALRIYSEELDYIHGNFRHDDYTNEYDGSKLESVTKTKALYRDEGIIYAMQWVYDTMDSLVCNISQIQQCSTRASETESNESSESKQQDVEGQQRDCTAMLMNASHPQAPLLVDMLQDVLDVGFNLAQMLDNANELNVLMEKIARQCKLLVSLTSPLEHLNKRTLYYEFKFWEFEAISHQMFGEEASLVNLDGTSGNSDGIPVSMLVNDRDAAVAGAREREIWALENAYGVFERMQQNGVYGSGNGLKDPYREGSLVLERLAVLQCQLGRYDECLQIATRALDLVDEVWDSERIVRCLQSDVSDCKQVKYRTLLASHPEPFAAQQSIDSMTQSEALHSVFDPGSHRVIPVSVAESVVRKLVITIAALLDHCSGSLDMEAIIAEYSLTSYEDRYDSSGSSSSRGSSGGDEGKGRYQDIIQKIVMEKFRDPLACFQRVRERTMRVLHRATSIMEYYVSSNNNSNRLDNRDKNMRAQHDAVFDVTGIFREKIQLLESRVAHLDKLQAVLEKTTAAYVSDNSEQISAVVDKENHQIGNAAVQLRDTEGNDGEYEKNYGDKVYNRKVIRRKRKREKI